MLAQQNRVLAGQTFDAKERITARGKHVLVIGGGDTGSDCIGTAHRQGALSVTQIEIMPQPPVGHNPATPWPQWPVVLKTSSSHEEGCTRRWSLNSNRFIGRNGRVTGVEVEEVEWLPAPDGGRHRPQPRGEVHRRRPSRRRRHRPDAECEMSRPQRATPVRLVAEALRNPANDRWELAEALRNPANDRWETAEALRNPANDRWETAEALRNPANDRWELAEALRNLANDRWPDNDALRRLANDRWQT